VAQLSEALLPGIHWIFSGVSWSVTAEQCSVTVLWPSLTIASDGNFVMTVFATDTVRHTTYDVRLFVQGHYVKMKETS